MLSKNARVIPVTYKDAWTALAGELKARGGRS